MKSTVATAIAVGIAMAIAQDANAQSYNPRSNYANPNQSETQQGRSLGCSDPWVGLALLRVNGRVDKAYCGTWLYNGGRWSDFNQLVHAVAQTRDSLASQHVRLALGVTPQNTPTVVLIKDNRMVAAGGGNVVGSNVMGLVGNDGSSVKVPTNLLGNDGGSLRYGAQGVKLSASKMVVRLPVGVIYYEAR